MKPIFPFLFLVGIAAGQSKPAITPQRQEKIAHDSSVSYCRQHPEGTAWEYNANPDFQGWFHESCISLMRSERGLENLRHLVHNVNVLTDERNASKAAPPTTKPTKFAGWIFDDGLSTSQPPVQPPPSKQEKAQDWGSFNLCDATKPEKDCLWGITILQPPPTDAHGCGWGIWDEGMKACSLHIMFEATNQGSVICSPVAADYDGKAHIICWYVPKPSAAGQTR